MNAPRPLSLAVSFCFLLAAAAVLPAEESGWAGPGAAASQLVTAVKARDPARWEEAEAELLRAGAAALPHLEMLRASREERVRFLATRVAGLLAPRLDAPLRAQAEALVLDALEDEDGNVRRLAREHVLTLRPRAAVPILIRALAAAEDEERRDVVDTLENLSRIPIGNSPEAWEEWWADAGTAFECAEAPAEGAGHGATENPVYHGETVTSRRVVFVVDHSLSMGWGGRILRAKRELVETIEGLPEEARFNIVFFGHAVSVWRPELEPATNRNKKSAEHWIREKELITSTATYPALAQALSIPGVDTIYLLSDGDPNVGPYTGIDEICREVKADNTFLGVRIYTIGLFFGEVPEQYRHQARDTSSTRQFMRRLAAENGGRFAEIDR